LLNETFVSDCRLFPEIYISQGSVSTRLRCDGIFNGHSLHDHCWVWGWKNFEICQHLPKLWAIKYRVVFYIKHCV